MLKSRLVPETYVACEICEKELNKNGCYNYFQDLHSFFRNIHNKEFLESDFVFCDDCLMKYGIEIEEVLYDTFIKKVKSIKEKHKNG